MGEQATSKPDFLIVSRSVDTLCFLFRVHLTQ